MKRIVAIDLASTNTIAEAFLSLRLLLTPSGLLSSPFKIEEELAKTLGCKKDELFFVDSGRTALTCALESLDLPMGSKVAIQGFTCIVVPNAVLAAGYIPVVCDLELEGYNIDPDSIPADVRVVIVQHTFGSPANISKLVQLCKTRNIYLIEDCAHSFGALIEGKLAGSYGDVSMYSFARDKNISTTIGGVIRINNVRLLEQMQKIYSTLPAMSYAREARSLLYIVINTFFVRPLYYVGNLGKAILYVAQWLKVIEKYYTEYDIRFHLEPALRSRYGTRLYPLLSSQLHNFTESQNQRAKISEVYSNTLGQTNVSLNNFRYILDLRKLRGAGEVKASEVAAKLQKYGYLVGFMYDTLFIPARAMTNIPFNFSLQTLKNTTNTLDRILNLPTHRGVTTVQAKYLSELVLKTVKNLSDKNEIAQ